MTKAFLYDSLCGMVYRAMFAGLDEYGKAQWINITPGEEPKTLEDFVADEDLEDMRFFVLSMEGEMAPTSQIAKVLGKVMEFPFEGIGADLKLSVCHMKELGVKWDRKPLELDVRVFENSVTSKRKGKYSFWVEDYNESCSVLADVDGYDDLDELFRDLHTYFFVLESLAEISVIRKGLIISDKLKKEVKKTELSNFDHVVKDGIVFGV